MVYSNREEHGVLKKLVGHGHLSVLYMAFKIKLRPYNLNGHGNMCTNQRHSVLQ